MITDRDREIINFIDDIGFATIKHISSLFFANSVYKQDLARKRLRKILKTGDYLKAIRNQVTNEVIYLPIDSKLKNVSIHNITILDYICKIKLLGADIEKIEIEPVYHNIKPDASLIFTFNSCRYYQLIEVQCRNVVANVNKYSSNEVIESILDNHDGVVPNLIIIQNTNKDYSKVNNTPFNIIQLRLDLEGVAKVLI